MAIGGEWNRESIDHRLSAVECCESQVSRKFRHHNGRSIVQNRDKEKDVGGLLHRNFVLDSASQTLAICFVVLKTSLRQLLRHLSCLLS